MSTHQKLFSFVCFALVCFNVSAAYPNPERFENSIKKFEENDKKKQPPEGAIVCVGSSSMRGWHSSIKKDLAPLTVIPRGFGGSNMNDVLHFINRIVINYKPRAILLYEGDNDMAANIKPEKFIVKFNKFVADIHKVLPETRIYVLAIKPSISRWKLWPSMKKSNKLLQEKCEQDELLTYIDIATPMLDANNNPKKEIFKKDNLHMNRKGYDIWTKTVKTIIDEKELKHEKKRQVKSK